MGAEQAMAEFYVRARTSGHSTNSLGDISKHRSVDRRRCLLLSPSGLVVRSEVLARTQNLAKACSAPIGSAAGPKLAAGNR